MVLLPDRAGEHAHAAAIALRRIGRAWIGFVIENRFFHPKIPLTPALSHDAERE
jgi:hypothetical protein